MIQLNQAGTAFRRHPAAMEIRFPGGLEVEAVHEGFTILTDQPVSQGGSGAAPTPFDLFLASIATCAGLYALKFCQQRNLDTEGLALSLRQVKDADNKRVAVIRIEITLPPGFPEKYREAILRAVDQCKVKRHILEAPVFEVTTVRAQGFPVTSSIDIPAPPLA
ncbi:MAG TPA: OsmC family protein [Myxococcales bacterium]|nr:OsmC family protein [Myxococcales bacterium]